MAFAKRKMPLVVGATGVVIERLMLSRLYKLDHLYGLFPREQVLVLRYRQMVDEPVQTLDRICAFRCRSARSCSRPTLDHCEL